MGIYFGRHWPAGVPWCRDDTATARCQVAPLTHHPGLQQVLAPGSSPDQVQGWRAAWLPKLPLVPSFHLLPAKFWNLFHIMNMSGVCAPVYMCLRSMSVSTVTYQCLQSHVCIRVWCKKWNQSCMSQLLQLFQATLTIRITVLFVTMSSPPRESSQPKNCGNIRKVNWNSFSILRIHPTAETYILSH